MRWENDITYIHDIPSSNTEKNTDDRKLLRLQFRNSTIIITTNRSVSKFKPNQCELGTFCNSNSETIEHVTWQCRYVQTFQRPHQSFEGQMYLYDQQVKRNACDVLVNNIT